MKQIGIYMVSAALILMTGCHGILDIEPNNKITPDELFKDPNGAKAFLATLYRELPIEDYRYMPGTNDNGSAGFDNPKGNIGLFWLAMASDEALQSQWGEENPTALLRADYFEKGYRTIRSINLFKSIIPTLDISEADKNVFLAEASFMTAWVYFYLAQKFGGVPIIEELQDYDPAAPDNLVVPRSTEYDTWNYVMEQCEFAARYLPESPQDRRASKWAARALQSRAALVAASVAKFRDLAPLSGEAVDLELAAMPTRHADYFYQKCIEACEDIIKNSNHGLYKPQPSGRTEAEENFRYIFVNPNSVGEEAIFIKGIALEGSDFASSMNYYLEPVQTLGQGRMSPALDLVDVFEDYTDAPGVRSDAPVRTRMNEDFSVAGFDPSITDYIKVDRTRPYDLFNGEVYGDPSKAKDARLWASVILPGTQRKGTSIVMQGGLIQPDGSEIYRVETTVQGLDGNEYHSLGGPNANTSGFYPDGSHSMSGFLLRKVLSEDMQAQYDKTVLDFIVFRYAEILLNYAEAVCESGQEDVQLATRALNDVRRRAAHTNDIPLTRENVRKERQVELAFENLRVWDLKRWRELHTLFTNYSHQILVPMLDLRDPSPSLIFVRRTSLGASLNGPGNYSVTDYYENVPRNSINNMAQNP